MAGAADATARLTALPTDATATEVLCAALGCDRRHLPALPGGASGALAELLGGSCDRDALVGLARDLDGAAGSYRSAASRLREDPLRELALATADDLEEAARRVRAALGTRG
ncbi:MAG: hypothetical protein Q4B91_03430 [Atopobiaceae bacterium]|nr:hypothetical protein [Atopobiaceae bacterium]